MQHGLHGCTRSVAHQLLCVRANLSRLLLRHQNEGAGHDKNVTNQDAFCFVHNKAPMLYRHNASCYGSGKNDATVKANAFPLAQLPGDVLLDVIHPFDLLRINKQSSRVAKEMISQEYPICGVGDNGCNVDANHKTVIESSKPLEGLQELCKKQSLTVIIKDTGGLEQQKDLNTVSKRKLSKAFKCVKYIQHQGETLQTLECLCLFITRGALASVVTLVFCGNPISDAGMQTFSTALTRGTLAQLQGLVLYGNRIGDVGMQAFSDAISGGVLSSLTMLDLTNNEIGDVGMIKFSEARVKRRCLE